jgi:hypothetical protein
LSTGLYVSLYGKYLTRPSDLKPENLLLDAHNNIKIADFGLHPHATTAVSHHTQASPIL